MTSAKAPPRKLPLLPVLLTAYASTVVYAILPWTAVPDTVTAGAVGVGVGVLVGVRVGVLVGVRVGVRVGVLVGALVGVAVGVKAAPATPAQTRNTTTRIGRKTDFLKRALLLLCAVQKSRALKGHRSQTQAS